MYVYQKTEHNLWTVGYYTPLPATWVSESDHDSPEKAAARVRYLNGGAAESQIVAQLLEACESLLIDCELCAEKRGLRPSDFENILQAHAAISAAKGEKTNYVSYKNSIRDAG